MNHRVAGALLVIVTAAAMALLGGCSGDAAHWAGPANGDAVIGHWIARRQSDTLTGTRLTATIVGNVSFVVTQSGVQTWSGTVTDASGVRLSPTHGPWARSGDEYLLTNGTDHHALFGWHGSELFSTTQSGGETLYLWWAKP